MNERDTPLPLNYRADLLERVMPALRAGECCSLVGTSGAGKSNLVRFLQRSDVQAAYWGDESVWMVLVDTNGLVFDKQPDEYAVAELMIHRLIREAERRRWDSAMIDDFDARYLQVVEHRNPLLAIRSLERICGQLCEAGGVRLVFLFDQFEDLWNNGDARLFLHLRYLRDEFKYRLNYLVMTRERLQRPGQGARTDLPEVESFWELFSAHTYGLGPYSTDDANHMIDRLAIRRGITVSGELREVSSAASGGHSGLLRALFWALHNSVHSAAPPDELLKLGAVAEECAKIWSDLLPDEQQTLREITLGAPFADLDEEVLGDLRLKKLVNGTPPRLFAPIFRAYVLRLTGDMSGLVVNQRLRQVWLDGRLLTRLSKLEFNLLEFLARNTDRICSREEILHHLYAKESYTPSNAHDERLDALIRRLREALKENASNPRYLHTRRGVGFQLINGRVQD